MELERLLLSSLFGVDPLSSTIGPRIVMLLHPSVLDALSVVSD